MTDTSLDRAIDDAARRLTAQEPPADLRARVMARIHERARPSWTWRLAPIAAGIVAVAAIGFALTIARTATNPRRAPAPSPISAAAPASAATATGTPSVASDVASAAVEPATRVKPAVKSSTGPTTEELAWLARAVPALEQPSALGVVAIQPEALTIHQIDVKPLVTEPLSASPGEGGGVKR